MRVVEVGQYFVTKNTGNLTQFRSVACREYTLPRDDPASQPKGWIQGNMRIGPVLDVTTSFQHFKYGIEIRIWSVNQDNSQSWVRISYGTVRYVIDSFKTTQKFLQIHKKSKHHKQASRWLQPGQRQKQNHNRESSLVARGMGSPRHAKQQAAADSRGSRTCVCVITFLDSGWHMQGGEG